MSERQVEVAVGLADHTWREIWVNVPQDPDYVLDEVEVKEKAHDIVMKLANDEGLNVSFIHIIYIGDGPGDPLDGLV